MTSIFGGGGILNANSTPAFEVQEFTVTDGQTLFTLSNFSYNPGTQSLWVFINGRKAVLGVDYTETSTNQFTWSYALTALDTLEAVGISLANITVDINAATAAAQASATASAASATTSGNYATAAGNSATASANSATSSASSAAAADASEAAAAAIVAGLNIPTGIVKGNGTTFSAAVAGTDYLAPAAIGTTVQAYDADLTTLGAGGASARSFLGLAIGTDVQAYDADTAKTDVVQGYTAQQYFVEATLTDAATISWDVAVAQVSKVTLAGNRTFGAPTNQIAGAYYGLLVIQDATGSRTGAWNSVFKFPAAVAPTLTTTANAKDFFVFRSDGTNMHLQGKSMDSR